MLAASRGRGAPASSSATASCASSPCCPRALVVAGRGASGDLLSENIIVSDKGLRLIDFDDAGDSWMLFDAVTACFDLKLTATDYFEPCMQGFVEGFRELRDLPEEHLAMLPAFFLARLLSYLAHTVSRSHLEQSAWMQPICLAKLEEYGGAYLHS